jgi:hypothetical protein
MIFPKKLLSGVTLAVIHGHYYYGVEFEPWCFKEDSIPPIHYLGAPTSSSSRYIVFTTSKVEAWYEWQVPRWTGRY